MALFFVIFTLLSTFTLWSGGKKESVEKILIRENMTNNTAHKHRIIVLTDIARGFEIDDIESMIRLLLYSNDFTMEAIVATTSCWYKGQGRDSNKEIILELIDEYAKVKHSLDIHASGFPEADKLRKVTFAGIPKFGKREGDGWGEEWMNDIASISHIINVIDGSDPRPVWILLWGGANVLAHVVWKVYNTRNPEEFDKFLSKIRVYGISDQDYGGIWLRENFGDRLFYVVSPSPGDKNGGDYYKHGVWPGISGDEFMHGSQDGYEGGGFKGAQRELISNEWLRDNIIGKGLLGAKYPEYPWLMEGDTPTFLYLIPNGLGQAEHPDYGSWGGRYEFYKPDKNYTGTDEKYRLWTNASDQVKGIDGVVYCSPQATIWRWREAYQNDFAARMDWSITDSYEQANHPPVAKLNHPNYISAASNEYVHLSAEGSIDPDGDDLFYSWMYYREAGNYDGELIIENADCMKTGFTAPHVTNDCDIHIVLTVKDNGVPSLCRYQRVIVSVHAKG